MPAPGDAEHQHDVGFLREQFWQIAIDRRVSGREYMRRTFDVSQSRPPPTRERLRQRRAGIERRTGKRAEAGDEDAHGLRARAFRRSSRPPWPAPAARPRPRLRVLATPL